MGGSSATPNWRDLEADSSRRVPESHRRNDGSHGLSGSRDVSTGSEMRRRVVLCECGVESPLVTTWTGVNRGRRFYGCGLFEVHRKKVCNFFQWHDADDNCNAREKKLIVVLTKKNEDLKKKERILLAFLFMSIIVILVLLVAYVRK
ncbi:uncharacterized protein LOC130735192 [Lotus japonicus]|uniref:uncharacterized protein LOC130715233 n=1 Tax=Lotus japonicus TaxID=34305 RepID=UPI002584484E|nr:uncharacterized protein LOC130715233 [Lotus japonicus]XP_057440744.1 uncharacterized protein LOC130732770 [Lotus japonicus]XP_057442987.1 uncharacterized protein LOC130734542 [Lotus japonicus]XP_057443261.1 uncharacterized protein LOC130735192 [Lotus japonicus]